MLRELVAEHGASGTHAAPSRVHPFPFEAPEASGSPAGAFVLVGETGGRVEAVASYQRSTATPDRAEITFAIAPALQGRGVGTRMLERLARIAWTDDIRTFDA